MAEIQPNWQSYYSPQAYDTFKGNPGLDDLNKRYAQAEKDRDLDRQLLGQQISKMNFGGVKPADVGDLQNQYNDVLNTYQKSRSMTDPIKRAQLTMQLKQQMNWLLYNTETKKENHSQELKMLEQMNHPTAFPADNAQQLAGDVISTPTSSPDYQSKLEAFRNGWQDKPVDLGKFSTNAFTKNLVKTKNTGAEVKDPMTGEVKVQTIAGSDVPKDAYVNDVVKGALGDRRTLHAITKQYPNAATSAEAVQQFADETYEAQKAKIHSDTTYSRPFLTMGNRFALQDNAAQLRSKYPSFGQQQNLTPIYRQKQVGDMLSGVENSGEQLKAKIDADPTYDKNSYGGLGFHIGTNGTKIALNVPAKTVLNPQGDVVTKIPQRQIVIDKKDPNADIKLNEALNELTGEKVDISSLRTQGGKKHVAGTAMPQKLTPQDFNSQWAKLPKGGKLVGPDGVTYTKK